MRSEMIFAGFGGQGIIMMGVLAAKAAGIYDGKNVAQSQSYGPAARGGACRTDVIISDDHIDYPRCNAPNVLVAMSNKAYDAYIGENKDPNAIIILDSSLVDRKTDAFSNVFCIPATDIAEKELGHKICTNVVMCSAIAAITGLISKEGIRKAIGTSVRPQFVELNEQAVDVGYSYGLEQLNGR